MKKYKAIFFDWDGTAVISRKASADKVAEPMKRLLAEGVKLAVISGTTMENIAGGRLHEYFGIEERKNLFLGLGRGAHNYSFDKEGVPFLMEQKIPTEEDILKIHDICYEIHKHLLHTYRIPTDIVFSRPNYCKIDLMVGNHRGDALFLQEGEREGLLFFLEQHGIKGGIKGVINLAERIGKEHGMPILTTTDAKYLEVGISSKSDNVDALCGFFQKEYGITEKECAFWGDEYIGFGEGIYGSDSFMITEKTKDGDFYDVSDTEGERPVQVKRVGGGVESFIRFLEEQSMR